MKRVAIALLLPAFMWAADPAGFVYWSGKDLKTYEQKLKPKMNEGKVASETLAEFGNHLTMIAHREGDGEAEVHDLMADFFVVQSGEATLVVGGKVVNGKTTAPNEIRAPKIDGGERRKLVAGDIVHIPKKIPHQLLIENGKQFTYYVIKVKE
jgi:mannose-6-phosphate isomerase-like protein (cupin superfamily)